MKKLITFLAIIAATIIFTACSTHKNSSSTSKAHSSAKQIGGSPEKRFEALTASYGEWTDVKLPVTLNLKSPVSISVGGTVTMVRDKSIHASFRFFGMEVLSIYVTPDSVFATYKMDKIYLSEPVDKLLKGFPITVGNLQSLLLGRVFIAGSDNLSADNLSLLSTKGGGYTVKPGAIGNIAYNFDVTPANHVESLTVFPPNGNPVMCIYGNGLPTMAGDVPSDLTIKATRGNKTIEAMLECNVAKARWNEGNARTWTAPKGYRRIDGNSLLNIITHL